MLPLHEIKAIHDTVQDLFDNLDSKSFVKLVVNYNQYIRNLNALLSEHGLTNQSTLKELKDIQSPNLTINEFILKLYKNIAKTISENEVFIENVNAPEIVRQNLVFYWLIYNAIMENRG